MSAFSREASTRTILATAFATIGGAALFLGWTGFGYWPLELVAFVPLFAALELDGVRSRVSALRLGWLFGTVAMVGGYHWMYEFTARFSDFGSVLSAVIFAGFSLALGLQYGVVGVLYVLLRRRGRSVSVSALPSLIATEWLFPTMFPVYIGTSLVARTLLVQVADLGGPLLLSFLVVVVNVAVFEALRWIRGKRSAPVALSAGAALVLVGALAYGAARIRSLEARLATAPTLEVGLVQVNMGVFEKKNQMLEAHRRHLEQSRELESGGELDLLVWPESAYNYPRFERQLPLVANDVRQDLRAPVLFGGLSVSRARGLRELYNSVFLTDSDGLVGERYDKTKLVMFGEYLPFGRQFPRLYTLSPNTGMFAPGEHLSPLSLGPWRLSTPVCYEAVLPDLVREMVLDGNPHLIVNLSNDAWFGSTQGPEIHLDLARLRAVEQRRALVRATNSGVSAIIDPLGRVTARTAVGVRANLRGTVPLIDGYTLYARIGDWPGWLSVAILFAALLGRPKRRTRSTGT